MQREVHIIMAIHITDRITNAIEIQNVFSKYGCYIKTRIGLHEASDNFCSPNGIVILELLGNLEKAAEMQDELNKIDGIEVEKIIFEHESENMSKL